MNPPNLQQKFGDKMKTKWTGKQWEVTTPTELVFVNPQGHRIDSQMLDIQEHIEMPTEIDTLAYNLKRAKEELAAIEKQMETANTQRFGNSKYIIYRDQKKKQLKTIQELQQKYDDAVKKTGEK